MKIRRISVLVLTLLLNLSIVACVTSLSHMESSSNSVIEYLVEDKKLDNKSEKTSLLSLNTFTNFLDKKMINVHKEKIYFFKFSNPLFKPPILT